MDTPGGRQNVVIINESGLYSLIMYSKLPFLDKIEIVNPDDIKIKEIRSDTEGLGEAVTDAVFCSMSPDALNELNYLASKIAAIHPGAYETFAAALEADLHCGRFSELINLTENLDRFELQPAFSAAMLGEHLLNGDAETYSDGYQKLYESEDEDLRRLISYIEILEKYVDYTAYGKEYAENENGVFTELGYLTEKDGFREIYQGPEDIPAEYRVTSLPEKEPPQKIVQVDLTDLLLKMHALGGDYMSDAHYNLNVLDTGNSSEYLLLMNGRNAYSPTIPVADGILRCRYSCRRFRCVS